MVDATILFVLAPTATLAVAFVVARHATWARKFRLAVVAYAIELGVFGVIALLAPYSGI